MFRYRQLLHTVAPLTLLGLALACGGDSDATADAGIPDAGSAADARAEVDAAAPAGPGLLVVGAITVANPGNADVEDGNYLAVSIALRVTRGGDPVTNAVVRVNPAPPAFETYLTGEPLDPSLYTGYYNGYHRSARVEIHSGDDHIEEKVLVGLDLFRITAPTSSQTLAAESDLEVAWTQPGIAADTAQVTTAGGYDSGAIDDGEGHTIAGEWLTTDTPDDQITVTRARRNDDLPGAADGSYIDFAIANTIAVSVQ